MHRRSGQLALDEAFGPFVHDRVVAEPCPKRVRARVDETWVLDSVDALLAWIEGPTPDYAVPVEDVDGDVLAAVERETDDRLGRVHPVALEVDGERTRAGVRVVEPPDSAPRLADHVVLDWDAVDAWFVEEERQRGHPRDPYRRIDLHESSREIVVEVGQTRLATSTRAIACFETGLPTRFYLPEEDVRTDLLEESDTVTRCAYKGQARHYHAPARGDVVEDAAWTYPDPEPGVEALEDRICFYDERVRVLVDGEEPEPLETPWS